MPWLDYSRYKDALEKHYAEGRQDRLVGVGHGYDSGYFDIVRFFGPDPLKPHKVQVRYAGQLQRQIDDRIAGYAADIAADLRGQGRLYDGPPTTAVVDFRPNDDQPTIELGAVDYHLTAGCCAALDQPHDLFRDRGETLRDYYLQTYPDRTTRDHPLITGLGVCGILLCHDEADRRLLLFVRRAAHLATLAGTIGPAVAGGVDYHEDFETLADFVIWQMAQETSEELNLAPHEFSVKALAYAREIFRGERPQIFCLIRTDLPRAEIVNRLNDIDETKREFDNFVFAELRGNVTIAADFLERLNHEGLMNYYLVQEFLTHG